MYNIYIDKDERFIQVNDISEDELAGVWEQLAREYPEYEVMFCFRDVPVPVAGLSAVGAVLVDDCVKMERHAGAHCPPLQSPVPIVLDMADFADFARLHDAMNPEMYWTSRRVWDRWEDWRIFVIYENGEIVSYTMLFAALKCSFMGEIFCMEADNLLHKKALFSFATNYAFVNGKTIVIRMAERADTSEQEAAAAAGFKITGFYQGYQTFTGGEIMAKDCAGAKECMCPATECANHKKCCDCVKRHREAGNPPFCLREKAKEE
ncbi:MAG: hypothetical protein FWB74_10315 [Defluviitaleaceae bacterium]|nr:hypothetical protein [Defluviitaleaceae bacterium]